MAQGGRDRARELFSEGVEASERGDWEAAASRFEEALSHHPAPSIEYNLAAAYMELGRLGEAGDLTGGIFQNAETPADINEAAHQLDEDIAARSGELTILVTGEGSTGATVRVDGRELPDSRLGIPRHETPGEREVTVTRVNGDTETRTVVVTEGEQSTETFGGDAGFVDDEAAGGVSSGDVRDGALTNPVFWGIVGGAVAIVIIAAIALAASAPEGSASTGMPLFSF
jgi:hypothetical protein